MQSLNFQYSGKVDVKLACHMGDYDGDAVCNLIGDQPLFYHDNIDETEESLLLSDDVFDDHIMMLQDRLDSYDKTAAILSNISMTSTDMSYDLILNDGEQKKLSINDIISYGVKSATFQSYLHFIEKYSVDVKTSTQVETTYFNKDKNTIFVNPYTDILTAASALIKTMRTVWTMKQGIMINPLSFQPDEAVLIHRLFMADFNTVQCAFLWDLKLSGDQMAWTVAMNSSDYDLYTAYAVEAMTDFRAIKSGLAARAVFEKWFMSDRCRVFDRHIIQTMLGHYADIEIEDNNTSKMVAKDIILRLGHRPMGKNYLSAIIADILHDAMYSEVRDRSNANFLWFITFEKRMLELEQHLQSDEQEENSSNTSIADFITTKEAKDNVHHLPNHEKQTVTNLDNGSGATLFFLDHFRSGS